MLVEQIKKEVTEALKAKDALRLEVLRGVLAAFTNELVAQKRTPQETLEDDAALTVIKRLVKQRKDSIEQFTKGDRQDLADKEAAELKILEVYLPAMMSQDEIRKVALKKKDELGIEDQSKAGMLVGAVMRELKGQADGADVKAVIDSLF